MAIVVRMLGPVEVEVDGRPVAITAAMQRGLLAVLALRANRVLTADELIGVLWGEAPPRTALRTLRSYVSRLRRMLPSGSLITEGPGYALVAEPATVDAVEFDELLSRAAAAGGSDAELRWLAEALRLWRGRPFADLPDSLAAQAEATRLDEARLGALERLLELRVEHIDRGAVGDLEVFVAEHPYRERAWELLMVALARAGRQADALRAFQRARATLVDNLGVEPADGLRALEERILAGDTALRPTADDGRATAAPARAPAHPRSAPWWGDTAGFPYVGRATEVEAALAAAEAGRERLAVVTVAGEPGVGKTRLTAEVAQRLCAADWQAAYGRCDPVVVAALRPVARALGPLVAHLDDLGGISAVGSLAPDLVRLFPEVGRAHPELGAPPLLDADVQRARLLDAAVEIVALAAATRPIVIVLDDLQWADALTVAFVRHLVEAAPLGCLLVLAYRDAPHDRAGELVGLLADLSRHQRVTRLALEGLTPGNVTMLVEELADGGMVDAEALWRRTAGNPFYLGLLLREGIPAGEVNETVRGALRQRVHEHRAEVRELVEAASVLGLELDAGILTATLGDERLDALDGAVEAGLIRAVGSARYRFVHELLREVVYEDLTPRRRSRLHWQVGRALADRARESDAAEASAIATHLVAGAEVGDPAVVAEACRRAAVAASEVVDHDGAAVHLAHAIAFHDQRRDGTPLERAQLGIALGAARSRGGHTDYRTILRDAAADARRAASPTALAEVALHLSMFSASRSLEEVDAEVVDLLEAVLADPAVDDPATRARLLAALTAELLFTDRVEERVAHRRSGVALAAESGDPAVLADVVGRTYLAGAGADNLGERLADSRRLLARRDLAAGEGRLWGELALASALIEAGEANEACAAIERARALVDELGHRGLAWRVTALAVCVDMLQGRIEGVEEQLDLLLHQSTDVGQPQQMLYARALVQLRYEQGRLVELEPVVTAMSGSAPRVAWQSAHAFILGELGRGDDARPVFEKIAARDFDSTMRTAAWTTHRVADALVAGMLGDRASAARLRQLLGPYAGRNCHDFVASVGPVDRALGVVAATVGDVAAADAHFEAAVALCDAMDAPLYYVRTRLDQARVARDVEGESERVRALVDDASARSAAAGADHLVDAAAAARRV